MYVIMQYSEYLMSNTKSDLSVGMSSTGIFEVGLCGDRETEEG